MRRSWSALALLLICFLFVIPGTSRLNAQITSEIRAHIDHFFVIGDTTLPPGEYIFRMMGDSDLAVMTVTSENDKTAVNFIVREAMDEHAPAHSVVVFRKYGNTEFLDRVFQGGSRIGVAVTEPSWEEARLVKQGRQQTEHREEQK